jgi:hypothetical protein
MIAMRRITADDWRMWREMRLSALWVSPYVFGSTLADCQRDGDTEQKWRDRLISVAFNVIADVVEIPPGLASGAAQGEDVELCSLWEAPSALCAGLGDALNDALSDWAEAMGSTRIVLNATQGNGHAVALNKHHGFIDAGRVARARSGEPSE